MEIINNVKGILLRVKSLITDTATRFLKKQSEKIILNCLSSLNLQFGSLNVMAYGIIFLPLTRLNARTHTPAICYSLYQQARAYTAWFLAGVICPWLGFYDNVFTLVIIIIEVSSDNSCQFAQKIMPIVKVLSSKKPLWIEWDRQAQKSGIRHTVFSVNGDQYTGEWQDNKKHGR